MPKFKQIKNHHRVVIDMATIIIMVLAALALALLLYFQLRPIKTVDIKVPVATDQASYAPGEDVSGLFFGEVFYDGKVEILREVFCKDYSGTITTEAGDDIFKGISKPSKLNGESRGIGRLPDNIPLGSNCVIQFINSYDIATPFGSRTIEIDYYTQNFAIVSVGRRRQLDCEAANGTECSRLNPSNETATPDTRAGGTSIYEPLSSDRRDAPLFPQDNSSSTPNNVTTPAPLPVPTATPERQTEPVSPPERCTVGLLGICLLVL